MINKTNNGADTAPVSNEKNAVTVNGKTKNALIFGIVGVFAAIVFGLLYLFVISPAAPAEGGGWSIGWFLFSFATGLTMIVLPCTLPLAFVIVPLSMGKGLWKGLSMAVAFGLGITATLSIYGILAALLGGVALDTLGADLEAVKNWVYFVAGIFALIFALSGIGLMKFHMPTYSGAAPAFIQKRQEVFKAFLLGVFLGNIGVGCPHPATPLLLIEIASSGDVLYGWLMFLVHAIGRVLPLLLLAFLAILGVNGLNWLLTRKDAVEKATGWAMVFVAGFILTLGLFTHDWWVNSGIHTALEAVTQESFFNAKFNENFDTDIAHVHGPEEGAGLFGQPLEWGHWFLVLMWLIPIWWWYRVRKKELGDEPPGGESCDGKLLSVKRNFLVVISIFLVLIFVYFLPKNFELRFLSGGTDHHEETETEEHAHGDGPNLDGLHMMNGSIMNSDGEMIEGAHMMPDGSIMLADGSVAGNLPIGNPFSQDVAGLPDAIPPEMVVLEDGDSYDISAYYVKKEVGNRTLRMLAYNGSVPGPFIKVDQGTEVTINFTNLTDLEQTIHSHGIRVDNLSDGVPGVTQDTLYPGESYTYTIKFDDAGVYWYHPHTRDDYGQEMGLYGNYLVDPEEEYPTPANREVPLIIDDILIENNKISEFYKDITNFALLGRFGNEYLVNGEKNYTMTALEGEVIRFLITNVSNARTYNLSIPGAEMKLVGADVGQYEREEFADDFLISPAERMIVEAYFESSGVYSLTHTMPDGEVEIARFVVTGENAWPPYKDEFRILNTNDTVVEGFRDFRDYIDQKPDKSLLLTVEIETEIDHGEHAHGHDDEGGETDHSEHAHTDEGGDRLASLQWDDPKASDKTNTTNTITWKLIDQDTGMESMEIPVSDWTFTEGDLVKVRLENDANADHVMQHPMHMHGQRFVILSKNGVPNDNMVWKDTVLVFPGETVDILADMSNLGEWMSHCHISEHLHAGMMMQFRVEDEKGYATGDEFRATASSEMQHGESASGGVGMMAGDDHFSKYEFDSVLPNTTYSVFPESTRFRANRAEEFTISLFDVSQNSVQISSTVAQPLSVTFVSSDNQNKVFTFPGNTAFDGFVPVHGGTDHDNSDGHHDPAPAPASDGHDHIHMNDDERSFALIETALAHGGVEDGHSDAGGQVFTYTMPIVFTEKGFYRAFIEFIPEGSTATQVVSFDVEVASDGFSIDNFGWSQSIKWFALLIVSIVLMLALSLGVYRYVVLKD